MPPSFQRIEEGSRLTIGGREWRVIVGEGHAPELACLYCAETGVLISSDQVLPKISPNISVQAHEPEGDPLARFLASLDKLRAALPAETLVLPSHNLPFFGLHTRIEELAAHHRARCGEVLVACVSPQSAVDLLPVLFRRPLDQHQTAFALGEALAHLHYLWRRAISTATTGPTASTASFADPDNQARAERGGSHGSDNGRARGRGRRGVSICALATGAARAAEPITIGFGMGLTGGLAAAGKSALLAMQIWQRRRQRQGRAAGPAGQARSTTTTRAIRRRCRRSIQSCSMSTRSISSFPATAPT